MIGLADCVYKEGYWVIGCIQMGDVLIVGFIVLHLIHKGYFLQLAGIVKHMLKRYLKDPWSK